MAAVVPTGSNPLLRTNDFTSYGGDLNKRNYQSQGAIDPQTDVTAQQFARITADLAACQRTMPFAVITYLNNDGSPAAPTISSVLLQNGVTSASYAGDSPPTGFPSAARNGTGDVTFTFASSYLDAYGVSGAFTARSPGASANGPATDMIPTADALTATTVQVVCVDDAGVAKADQFVTLEVYS